MGDFSGSARRRNALLAAFLAARLAALLATLLAGIFSAEGGVVCNEFVSLSGFADAALFKRFRRSAVFLAAILAATAFGSGLSGILRSEPFSDLVSAEELENRAFLLRVCFTESGMYPCLG